MKGGGGGTLPGVVRVLPNFGRAILCQGGYPKQVDANRGNPAHTRHKHHQVRDGWTWRAGVGGGRGHLSRNDTPSQ